MNTTVRQAERVVTDLSLADLFASRFPSPELVDAAAAMFPALPRWDGAEDVRRFRLEVGPGSVGLAVTDPARRERRRDNPDLGPLTTDARFARLFANDPHVDEFIYGTSRALVHVNDPGARWDRSPTRVITSWSRKSRSRMVRHLADVDYRDVVTAGVPAMVTLTYPGDWQPVAPDGATVKAHLKALRKRWLRRWGSPLVGPWKLEFQRRGAPHIHVWTCPPRDPRIVGAGSGILLPDKEFAEWLSAAWADVVAHPDPVQRRRHESAGTAVDYAEGTRYADPRRLSAYFSGHSLKHADGKEYQHVVPVEWRSPGHGPGRFWGVWGLRRVRRAVEVDLDAFLLARRVLRRLSQAPTATSVGRAVPTRRVVVDRVDVRTGVVRKRTVTRRVKRFDQSALVGGWLLSNDAPALAALLSKLQT